MKTWKPFLWIAAGLAVVWFFFFRKSAAQAKPTSTALQIPGGGSLSVPNRLIPADVVQASNGVLRSMGGSGSTSDRTVAALNAAPSLLTTIGRWLGIGQPPTTGQTVTRAISRASAAEMEGTTMSRYNPGTGTSYIGDLATAPDWYQAQYADWGVTGFNASYTDQLLLDPDLGTSFVPTNYVTDWWSLGDIADTSPAFYWGDDWSGF